MPCKSSLQIEEKGSQIIDVIYEKVELSALSLVSFYYIAQLTSLHPNAFGCQNIPTSSFAYPEVGFSADSAYVSGFDIRLFI